MGQTNFKQIQILEKANEKLLIERGQLKERIENIEKAVEEHAGSVTTGYIYYLQRELKRFEETHVLQNETIEAYKNHFNKFKVVYSKKI